MKHLFVIALVCGITTYLVAQSGQSSTIKKQIIRGYIVDRTTGKGIENAYVELLNHTPRITAVSAEDGSFELKNIPVGHQRVRVELTGYYEAVHNELVVAGKQSIISIGMDEKIEMGIAVVEATGSKRKDNSRYRSAKMEASDEMNPVSTIVFDVDEVTKYVGGFGDPARTLTNFSGMFNIDDTQNYIVSRGNSPYGIQWLIEGVPIENPHHFATMGNTGGVFPILNNNLLYTSDFVNGALAAQYGNVFSGVFDVQLRTGNNDRFEFAAQLSTFGAEFVAEGPFKKKGASFAVAARASIFDALQAIGLDIGTNATPRYYDLNFKIDIPTKKAGTFSIFGIGGYANTAVMGEDSDSSDLFAEPRQDFYVQTGTGVIGVKHLKYLNQQTSITTTLSYNIASYESERDTILTTGKMPFAQTTHLRQQVGLSSVLNKKFSTKFTFRAGINGYLHLFNISEYLVREDRYNALADNLIQVETNAYAQVRYKFSPRLVLTAGLHGLYWSLNRNAWAVEPRVALNWYVGKRHKLSLGYGWHSKMQNFATTFRVRQLADDMYTFDNRNLGVSRSHHLVLSYDVYLAKYWMIRTNVYTQYATDIAVEARPSAISLINYGASGNYPTSKEWVNEGLALNYGVELTLEKFFNHGYYGLLSGSYQRAFYQASDQIWRNAAFDAQYISSVVMGKEFKIGKQKRNIIYADLQFNLHGGLPYTPIDLEASRQAGETMLDYDQAYSQRLGIYKRIDLRIGARFNQKKKRISHHIYIEAINVANFKNDLDERYSVVKDQIVRAKQFGFVPNLFYQIRF